jgi:hypothetical protein
MVQADGLHRPIFIQRTSVIAFHAPYIQYNTQIMKSHVFIKFQTTPEHVPQPVSIATRPRTAFVPTRPQCPKFAEGSFVTFTKFVVTIAPGGAYPPRLVKAAANSLQKSHLDFSICVSST